MSLDKVIHAARESLGRIVSRSALNPILWLCGLTVGPGVLLAIAGPPEMKSWGIVIAAFPIALAGFGFLWFLFRKPEFLRSEEFQLRQQSIELLGEKGKEFDVTAENLVSLAKPTEYLIMGPKKKDEVDPREGGTP